MEGTVVIVMALIVWIVQSGGFGFGMGGVTADQYLTQAMSHWTAHHVVHETGSFSLNGHRYQLDVTQQLPGGDGQGTVSVDGTSLQYRYAGGSAYVVGPQEWWAGREPKLAAFLAGKWATSQALAEDLSTTTLRRSLTMLDRALPGKTYNQKGGTIRVNGAEAVKLSDSTGDVYVTTGSQSRFVRLVSRPAFRTPDGVSAIRIDLDYPAALTVQPPDQAVDTAVPKTLPARYTLVEGSFKHGTDCDTANRCTLTDTVRNVGGPQVDNPSVEFHLNKADGGDLGGCTAAIRPVANEQTEDVSCTVSGQAWTDFTKVGGRYQVKANLHNPLWD
jgi:hypothetical protein